MERDGAHKRMRLTDNLAALAAAKYNKSGDDISEETLVKLAKDCETVVRGLGAIPLVSAELV